VLEDPEVDDGVFGGQLANDERHQSEDAEEGEDADSRAAEPVLALSGVEHDLQHAEAEGEESDAPEVHPASFVLANVTRVVDEGADHQHGNNTDGEVDLWGIGFLA